MEVMSTYNNSCQQDSLLVNEIIRGMELARQLRANLGPEFSDDTKSALLRQILSSFDKALLLLGHPSTIQQPHQLATAASSPPAAPSSSISITGASSNSADLNVALNGHHPDKIVTASKKRKATASPVKIEQVRAKPGNGLESEIPDDGFNWRKYGQKDILGAKHPRGYYRCTYRGVQNCRATRKVQRSDDDPTLFNISYKGKHTCCVINRHSKPQQPTIIPKGQHQHPPSQNNVAHHYDYASILAGFQAGLDVTTTIGNMDTNGMMMNFPFQPTFLAADLAPSSAQINNRNEDFYGTHSSTSPSPLKSPSVSGSTYFSPASSSGKLETLGGTLYQQQQYFGSDIAEIISAAASVTNSPCIEPDFSLETWGFDSSFPHDDPSFFY